MCPARGGLASVLPVTWPTRYTRNSVSLARRISAGRRASPNLGSPNPVPNRFATKRPYRIDHDQIRLRLQRGDNRIQVHLPTKCPPPVRRRAKPVRAQSPARLTLPETSKPVITAKIGKHLKSRGLLPIPGSCQPARWSPALCPAKHPVKPEMRVFTRPTACASIWSMRRGVTSLPFAGSAARPAKAFLGEGRPQRPRAI